jgi:hypothetical protein
MTSQSWYEPPDGSAPQIGDEVFTASGTMTITAILDQRGASWLVRLEGDDPQPFCP